MHETRFVNEIFAILDQKLDKAGSLSKISVNVRLSTFSHVGPQNLKDTFKQLSPENKYKNVSLNVAPLEIKLTCNACKKTSLITKKVFGCPVCESADVNLTLDREFFVESIEIEKK